MITPHYADEAVTLHHGDCLDVLRTLPDVSVDAVVTDPPYELGFMGRAWDASGIAYNVDLWREAWRVLKPGGHLLAFGGTRTVHRLTCAVEDAGFEIRDGIDWIYGSGFPKSLNVGDGRGTALKPAREPIVVARKPLAGTVTANVLAHGTGALNIDACRVAHASDADLAESLAKNPGRADSVTSGVYGADRPQQSVNLAGRWPSNVVLSHAPDCGEQCAPGCPVAELDRQSGVTTSSGGSGARSGRVGSGGVHPFVVRAGTVGANAGGLGDTGGASRFFPVFRYEAKAPTAERPRTTDGTAHPTVKPLDLMRWLVRLVTPPGGVVLEPFAGSGTTAEACVLEGFRCIAIERDETYLPLITARLTKPLQPALDFGDAA